MFILSEEEQQSFLKIVYTIFMLDNKITDDEATILNCIQNEVFNLNHFDRIDLNSTDKLVLELNKIKKEEVLYYLFKIIKDVLIESDYIKSLLNDVNISSTIKRIIKKVYIN